VVTLWANADPSALGGGAGWAGAGLLGLVLSWLLLKHLPDKDRYIRDLMDRHDAATRYLTERFGEGLRAVTEHCREELAEVSGTFRREVDRLIEAVQGRGKTP
jgi:hypothetical protein